MDFIKQHAKSTLADVAKAILTVPFVHGAESNDLYKTSMEQILENFTEEQLASIALTCQKFTAVASDVFKRKYAENSTMNTFPSQNVHAFGGFIENLTVSCTPNGEVMSEVHQYCRNLKGATFVWMILTCHLWPKC